ncbi:ABC transporter substrate-binding protein, partial [Elioraea sp.]|uniref:ABC transporter substrate-binding protein n=1 Tax=Elioraea sp. TaxID=2185103 RepID=UPI003F715846
MTTSRRTLFAGASALAAAGLLDHLPGRAARAAERIGTLKIALLGLDTADPHRHTGSIAVQQVYVEGLTSIADDGRAIPYLAESWQVEDDGRRYVFRIREGVRFHNGRVMTAEDVKANAERVRDRISRGWLSAPMKLVTRLEAPDARTFVMEMSEPYGPLLNLLSELWIMGPESEGWSATIRQPIGTGPFRFTRWVP